MATRANPITVRRSARLAGRTAPKVTAAPQRGVKSGRVTKAGAGAGKAKKDAKDAANKANTGPANAKEKAMHDKKMAQKSRLARRAELRKRLNVEGEGILQHEKELGLRREAFDAGMQTAQWNAYIKSIVPFRFYDLPLEIQNMVYRCLVKDVPSSYQRLTPALIGYSDKVTPNLEHQQEHFQWIFKKLALVPRLGPSFMRDFYCTTTIYLDFYEFTNPLYGELMSGGGYQFQVRTRTALSRIRAILTRFRHIRLMLSEGNMVTDATAEHLEDVVDRILLPRQNSSGVVTVSINLDHILRLKPIVPVGKTEEVARIIKKLDASRTVRLELYQPDTSKEPDDSVRKRNLHRTRFYLRAAGVDLTTITIE